MTVDPSITHLPKEGSTPLNTDSTVEFPAPQRSVRAAIGVAAAFAVVTTALIASTAAADNAKADASPLAGAQITVDLSTRADLSGPSLSINRSAATPRHSIGTIGPVGASSMANVVAHAGPEAHSITIAEATKAPEPAPEPEQPAMAEATVDAEPAAASEPDQTAPETTAPETTEPAPAATTEPAEEPVAEAVEEPVAEPAAESIAEPVEEPVEEPAAEAPVEQSEVADPDTDTTADPGVSTDHTNMMFPVVGPMNYSDTWGACRGVGCSRRHKGADIFSHKLTPLVAAADGVISSERRSGMSISGNTVIVTGDDGWRYLYIHLNNDSPGTDDGSNPQGWIIPNRLRVGDRVKAGDVIGYLGDSGNAENTPDHVHFEIHEPGVGAINPTPMITEALEAGRVVSVTSLASTPDGRAEHAPTVVAWYQALLKRDPTDKELFAWTDRFDIGFADKNDLIADLTMHKARRDAAGAIVRSFRVALDRLPTINEIRLWEEAYRKGMSLEGVAKTLIESAPFESQHGTLSNEAFVDAVYRNAVGTGPSERRLGEWMEELNNGASRASVAAYLADSYSVKNSTWHGLEVIQSYRAGLDRMPTVEEYDLWVGHLDAGGLIPDVVEGIRGND